MAIQKKSSNAPMTVKWKLPSVPMVSPTLVPTMRTCLTGRRARLNSATSSKVLCHTLWYGHGPRFWQQNRARDIYARQSIIQVAMVCAYRLDHLDTAWQRAVLEPGLVVHRFPARSIVPQYFQGPPQLVEQFPPAAPEQSFHRRTPKSLFEVLAEQ